MFEHTCWPKNNRCIRREPRKSCWFGRS